MLDRASTFAQPEIVDLLKTQFVPIAIDQAYQRRQKDTEGDFFRKIAGQSPRNNFNSTTQGFYIVTANGDLLLYNNNRNPEKLLRLMKERLKEFELSHRRNEPINLIQPTKIDPRYNVAPPSGGLVVRLHAKVLSGYEPTTNRWRKIFQSAVSRDNLWITADEHQQLVAGRFTKSLQQRIARFHLVDNTRGEPPMWRAEEVVSIQLEVNPNETDRNFRQITGSASLKNRSGDRTYDAKLLGEIKIESNRVVQLDMVCLGQFSGEGPYTRGAPKGNFPLAIRFSLADGNDVADSIPPQGSRGWVDGYLK